MRCSKGLILAGLFILVLSGIVSGCDSASRLPDPVYLAALDVTDLSIGGVTFNPDDYLTSYTETDPVVAALSGLIKASGGTISAITDNSSNWNTAYGWGNHASAGYLTSTLNSNVTLNGKYFLGTSGGATDIVAGLSVSGAWSGLKLITNPNRPNWYIAANYTLGGLLEFTPSTTNGGSSYTTPAFAIHSGTYNVGIGTYTWGTSAAGVLAIKDGTAPSSSPSGSVQLYSESGELKVRDSSGNVTTLSPHPDEILNGLPLDEVLPWVYYSFNPYIGKEVSIDMIALVQAVEKLTGDKIMTISDITLQNWDADQAAIAAQRDQEIAEALSKIDTLLSLAGNKSITPAEKSFLLNSAAAVNVPEPYVPEPMPQWMKDRITK